MADAKARKGDLVLAEKTLGSTDSNFHTSERKWLVFGRVVSATRDGIVKVWEYQPYKGGNWMKEDVSRNRRTRLLVMPKEKVKLDELLKAFNNHTYPDHPNEIKPFESIEEAQAFLRHFKP